MLAEVFDLPYSVPIVGVPAFVFIFKIEDDVTSDFSSVGGVAPVPTHKNAAQ